MGIWQTIKELVQKMLPKKTIEEVLQINPTVSDRMSDAIQLWSDMYEGCSPWLKVPTFEDPTRIVSLGLPALIASEKARMATLEMKSEISPPMKAVDTVPQNKLSADTETDTSQMPLSGIKPATSISPSSAFEQKTTEEPDGSTERAEFLNKEYKKLIKQIRRQLEYGIAKGGIVIKPYIVIYDKKPKLSNEDVSTDSKEKNTTESENALKSKISSNSSTVVYDKNLSSAEIEFDFVQADRFFPLAFDANGKVIEAAFIQTKVNKALARTFIRVEYHKLEKRKVTVENLAFESQDMTLGNYNNIRAATNIGKRIPLTDVPEWATLKEKVVIEGVDRLLFAYFRMPEANTVDPYSPLGVSGYSRVIQLIKDADMQYSRMLWEFEAGEMAIDVDRDAMAFIKDDLDPMGRSMLPQKQQRLFRKVDLNAEDTYNVFAPALRDTSLLNGLNAILTRIEDATGLSRGTMSEVTMAEAKTATELKILKQRSYATNCDIQMALQEALEDAIYVMDVYCTLYEVTPEGKYEASFEWDDSIIVDSESELSKRITLMQNGLASKLENRMWYFGETENQARQALQQIDEEARQAMLQNAEATALTNNLVAPNNEDGEDAKKSPADTTDKKISQGKQADSLDNPDKSKVVDDIKGKK